MNDYAANMLGKGMYNFRLIRSTNTAFAVDSLKLYYNISMDNDILPPHGKTTGTNGLVETTTVMMHLSFLVTSTEVMTI